MDPNIPRSEFEERMGRAVAAARSRGLDGLLVVSRFFDRPGHVLYLANHYPPFPFVWTTETNRGRGHAMLILPTQGDPVLVVDSQYYRRDLVAVDDVRVDPNVPRSAIRALQERKLGEARVGLVGEDVLSLSLYKDLTGGLPGIELVPADDIVESMRVRKSPAEQAIMREAAAVADRGLAALLAKVKPGVTEIELYATGVHAVLALGAIYCRPRIMSGPVSGDMALRWPPATERVLEDGDVVVVDFWGYYKNYLFDITRTAVAGRVSREKKVLLEAGLRATQLVIEAMRPGVTPDELVQISSRHYQQVKDEYPYLAGGYHGHQIGHGIGLESERPRLCKGEFTPLEPGNVVSVEPGLYVPGFAGVRVEDEVLVTDGGVEVLTQLPHVFW